MKLASRLSTIARTVSHLRPAQIVWRPIHAARVRLYNRVPTLGTLWVRPDPAARAADLPTLELSGLDLRPAELWRQGSVEYHGIRGPAGDWQGEGHTRLWRYERQYHSELASLAATRVGEARALVDDWIAHNPPCRGEAWEPYPVARRLINWCMAGAIARELRAHLAPWMAAQMRFLAGHLERHLLGNHLLCDLCAIVGATAFLNTADSEALGTRMARRLEGELARQVLPDGGYAERTVQYHLWVLHDALWVFVLQRARGRSLHIGSTLNRMLAWVGQVRRPDGSFPWLNDAAPDATPSVDSIVRLAKIAGLAPPAQSSSVSLVELPDTGWSIVREDGHELLFEHGIVGPEHQPGHGHADALSFELVWAGVPVVTDTGVTTYADGEARSFERSARAHATIAVDTEGADETWASFRVGGRSRPVYLGHDSPGCGSWLLRAHVRSYRGWLHRRGLLYWPGRFLVVCDEIVGIALGAAIVSTLPLAPDWDAIPHSATCSLSSPSLQLEAHVLKGRLVDVAARGEYPSRPGWVGCGFGRAHGRVSLSLVPEHDGQLVYAVTAPGLRVSLEDGALIKTSDNSLRQVALKEVWS
jgi:uncharacterized heparinase superfamily protein